MTTFVRACSILSVVGLLGSLAATVCLAASGYHYRYRLEAYDHGRLVTTEPYETDAQDDRQAENLTSNKLAVWGQKLNGDKKEWNRLHAVPLGKTPKAPDRNNSRGLPKQGVLKIQVILHYLGQREFKEGEWAGTKGESRIMEGFSVSLNQEIPGVVLEYMAHIQGKGDTNWVKAGTLLRGEPDKVDLQIGPIMIGHKEPDRIEGLAFRLTGENANKYDISYRGHLAGRGDTDWFKNGAFCGTRGESRRLEAFVVVLVRKEQ